MKPPFPYLWRALARWDWSDLRESFDEVAWSLRHPREILYDDMGNEVESHRWLGRQTDQTVPRPKPKPAATACSAEWMNQVQEQIVESTHSADLALNRIALHEDLAVIAASTLWDAALELGMKPVQQGPEVLAAWGRMVAQARARQEARAFVAQHSTEDAT